jgi:hypothetical protein
MVSRVAMPVPHAASATGISFWIHVSPGAKRETIGGVHGDALRIAVQAPPLEGRANAACARALAAAFGVKGGAVALDPGARGRRKRVSIAGDPVQLAERLAALASPG